MKGAGEGEGGERIPIGVISRRYPASLMLTRVPISRGKLSKEDDSSSLQQNEKMKRLP